MLTAKSYKNEILMRLFNFFNRPKLYLTPDQQFLEVSYQPQSEKPLYDICDESGRIIKTGKITRDNMRVAVADLFSSGYIFLILDGDEIRQQRFKISR